MTDLRDKLAEVIGKNMTPPHGTRVAQAIRDRGQGDACDECGEVKPLAQTVDDYGQSFGGSYKLCEACYNSHPEPDTGRPDWEDLI